MNAIELKNVTKEYIGFKLDNISFCLPQGYILGLVGENGAGKSTTIELIMNMIQPDSGSISVLGVDNQSKEFDELKQDIGVVLDEANYHEVLNIRQIGNIMANTYKKWSDEKYKGYIKRFKLPEKKVVKEFSRGMRMKLSIAVALSHDPKLLILDEATSGLDPIVRDDVLDVFNEFTRDEEHTIVISSHILSDLEKVCDYIAFIHEGELVFIDEKDALIEKYGIVHTTKEDADSQPPELVIGRRDSKYGVEMLVRKDRKAWKEVERATVEDIILFLVRKSNV